MVSDSENEEAGGLASSDEEEIQVITYEKPKEVVDLLDT